MKSALEIVAYTNSTQTEGTIALLEVVIAALNRSGFVACAEIAGEALDQFIEETVLRLKGRDGSEDMTKH